MTNPPKQRGTAAESALVKLCTAWRIPAERRALKGNADEGDVWLFGGRIVVEVKSRRTRPADEEIARMWGEANREAARVPQSDVALLVLKRPGKAHPSEWWAVMNTAEYVWLCGLDPEDLAAGNGVPLVTVRFSELLATIMVHPTLSAQLLGGAA